VDPAVNARALALAAWVRAQDWPGVRDVVPAMASVAVHVSPGAAAGRAVADLLAAHLDAGGEEALPETASPIEIAVAYGGDDGPDLAQVAAFTGRSQEEVVRRHCAVTYRVCMLGFLPGFPYLGFVDPAIRVPRRAAPRTRVARGAVGLAGAQTGIYPRESPGGWQIIGRTDERLFDASRMPPARLAPGDRVRFVASPAGRVRPDGGGAV
jgi:KipI family sensor histidine kinase inhibitor